MSEAFVLRTYPFQEADLIVSFFTREQGKLRGTAKRARRPKSAFGAGLERLSQVRMAYYQRENAELVRLEGCEIIQSQFGLMSWYGASVVLDFIAEVTDQLLPPAEPNERFYRLIAAVLADLRLTPETGVWRAVTYFSYWAVRLSGFLPELQVSRQSQELGAAIAATPIGGLAGVEWTKDTAADLRRFLIRQLEEHLERKLVTVPQVETL